MSYDDDGRLKTIADSSGRKVTLRYDTRGQLKSVSDDIGHTVHYRYDSAGNLASFQDPLGSTTQYKYDSGHRLLSTSDPLGSPYPQSRLTPEATGLPGVTLSLNGPQPATTVTDSSGNYAFSNVGQGSFTLTPSLAGYSFTPPTQSFTSLGTDISLNFTSTAVGSATISGQVTMGGVALSGASVLVNGSVTTSTTTDASGRYSIQLPNGGSYSLAASYLGYSFTGPFGFSNLSTNQAVNFQGVAIPGLAFYPVPPCRVADTRPAAGKTGVFGPPAMTAATQRSFPIPLSSCGIPSTAAAYSLNFTIVPQEPLGVLTTWPTGQPMPTASTLNSYTGTVVANAAIVPAGTGGAISVYVSNVTDVLFDINGYFAPPQLNNSGLLFFPVTPCRVVDTRVAGGMTGLFGPPAMAPRTSRSFPISSGSCNIPASAAAYSLNVTAVPREPLGVLTIWPTGQAMPVASTLNSYTGGVVANAAIVPAGASGAVSVYSSDLTELIFDINGYYAPPASGGMRFYPTTPCRIADTRAAAGNTGPFGPPSMSAGMQRSFPIVSSNCGVPSGASAYSFNFTVVPRQPLGVLTTWPTGLAMPTVSTLNSYAGSVVANAATVSAGSGGAISVYVNDPTDVLFDINGYFAP